MINPINGRARRILLSILPLALLASCNDSTSLGEKEIEKKLTGTWASKYEDQEGKTRVVTELAQDGSFFETEKRIAPSREDEKTLHAGEWSFDGKNFKRKYTKLEGKPLPNSKFGYATYAIQSLKEDEFIGIDNIRGETILFSRVPSGTLP